MKPAATGIGEQSGDEGSQPPLVLLRRMRLCRRGGHERADAAAGLQDARAFELHIDARHGVGVEAQFDGELADGRQLIADGEPPGRNRRAQRTIELRVDRRPVARIDGDDRHEFICTSRLVQCQP